MEEDDVVKNPHPVDENPEDHIGVEISDPWVDPEQTDWPNNPDDSDTQEVKPL